MKVVLSATYSIGGWIIRVGTRSAWNHCDVLFDDGTLIGSTGAGGVKRITLDERLNCGPHEVYKYRIDEIKLTDEEEAKARAFAEAQVGKPYDFTAVFAFALPWRENWNVKRKWFCSELVAAVINSTGRLFARKDAHRITPNNIDESSMLTTILGPIDR